MNSRRLFVGNLGSNVSADELREQLSYFGRLRFLKVIEDKGIAFVGMASKTEAHNARMGLNGIQLNGRRIRVTEMRPKKKIDRAPEDV